MERLKVLVHAPTPDALQRAQANVRNLLKLEPNAEVELVVNGPAAAAVEIDDDDLLTRLVLCRNSLDKQNLTPQSEATVVAAAVQHLARRQQQGWSYIRA
ncbi:hypothetical protein [Marinobacterium sediminicola]|uniref:Intracellular sulfur oxidation protein, DsrE/DsrF family n=1 Tax=Marinobacterium sediminicola TaxID=518898 RepID=A0ABY1RXH3_9GAMM|nr:hypothetical protein [Marinobacterium sediminicola]ULG67745.1 hypothetical protein LN244_08400 [Marinobacterium sediminicola]SMR71609.1 Intracellular sulfur oxidation protein, DsrE/DsrF family [Marinobacterium sediminicola]